MFLKNHLANLYIQSSPSTQLQQESQHMQNATHNQIKYSCTDLPPAPRRFPSEDTRMSNIPDFCLPPCIADSHGIGSDFQG